MTHGAPFKDTCSIYGGMSAASEGIPILRPISDASSIIRFDSSSSHAREWWCALRMRTILRALPSPPESPLPLPPANVEEDEEELTWSTRDLRVSTILASCMSTVWDFGGGEEKRQEVQEVKGLRTGATEGRLQPRAWKESAFYLPSCVCSGSIVYKQPTNSKRGSTPENTAAQC